MPRLSRKRNLRGKRKSFKSRRRVVKKRISKRRRKMCGGNNKPEWEIEADKLVGSEISYPKFKNTEDACKAIKKYATDYLSNEEWYIALLSNDDFEFNPCIHLFKINYIGGTANPSLYKINFNTDVYGFSYWSKSKVRVFNGNNSGKKSKH